jgi:hypothetical protein
MKKIRPNKRNCQCDLWQTQPHILQEQSLPEGYCGFCSCCNQLGHFRHAPGISPSSDAWCDVCYRKVWVRNNVQALSFVGAVIAMFFAYWLLALCAGLVFVLTSYFVMRKKRHSGA